VLIAYIHILYLSIAPVDITSQVETDTTLSWYIPTHQHAL